MKRNIKRILGGIILLNVMPIISMGTEIGEAVPQFGVAYLAGLILSVFLGIVIGLIFLAAKLMDTPK
jgi:hypothetical protein